MNRILTYVLLILFFSSFLVLNDYFKVPKGWPQPVYDFKRNKLSVAKIELGRRLFYDPILSADSSVSCASCHSPYNSFAHADHALSHGIHDSIGNRNAPVLLNLAWQRFFMHDGAIRDLNRQALFPIQNRGEMDEQMPRLLAKLKSSPKYQQWFQSVYHDHEISEERILLPITQFVLSLVSAESKYDSVMRKESFFTPQEASGYAVFQKKCSSCHTEPLFTNGTFRYNGISADSNLKDFGRMSITGNRADSLQFKVPTLRNIAYSFPYMHDGRFNKLSEVLKHYASLNPSDNRLPNEIREMLPINSNERVDLIAFLLTLSDRHFLFDPAHAYPKE